MLKWSLFFRCFLLVLNTREKTVLHESVTKSSLLVSPTDTVILSLARWCHCLGPCFPRRIAKAATNVSIIYLFAKIPCFPLSLLGELEDASTLFSISWASKKNTLLQTLLVFWFKWTSIASSWSPGQDFFLTFFLFSIFSENAREVVLFQINYEVFVPPVHVLRKVHSRFTLQILCLFQGPGI